MIDRIEDLHSKLQKGESIKILTSLPEYTTYISRTDLIRIDDNVLEIYRANDSIVFINTDHIVMCCLIRRL